MRQKSSLELTFLMTACDDGLGREVLGGPFGPDVLN